MINSSSVRLRRLLSICALSILVYNILTGPIEAKPLNQGSSSCTLVQVQGCWDEQVEEIGVFSLSVDCCVKEGTEEKIDHLLEIN